MRKDLEYIRSKDALEAFHKRYEELRAEKLTNAVIAQRMGVTPSGLNERRKLYKQLRMGSIT